VSRPTKPILTMLALLGLAGGTAGAAAPGPTATSEPPSLSELARAWTRPLPTLPVRGDEGVAGASRMDALSALSGGHRPERCATSLLLALHQHAIRLNQPTRRLQDRAVGVTGLSSTHASAGGEFLIHYTTLAGSTDRVDAADLDLNGVPDGVERLGVDLTDVLADFVHVLGWPAAPLDNVPGVAANAPIDVYLVGLSAARPEAPGPQGFTRPLSSAAGLPVEELPEATGAAIYLNAALASPAGVTRALLTHQIAHLVQMRESARESVWWHEASATWVDNHLQGNATVTAASLTARGAQRSRGLDHSTAALGLEAFLWPHYLVQSAGTDASLVRRLWEEMAAVPGNNTLDAMDRVLRRTLQSSLADEIRLFNIWNLFLGRADDGRHYPFASLLPTPREDAAYEVFPVRASSLNGPMPSLGSAVVRLLGDGSQGGLTIRFQGVASAQWDVALLVHSAERPGDVRYVPLELDVAGRTEVTLPWRRLAALDLLMQNLSVGAPAADYSFSIDYDPTVPFDLLAFLAEPAEHGVSLSWSTEDEQRLAGWNIYRGTGPLGPFSRLNPWLIPGGGVEGRPMGYVYVDSSAQPGRKYYYQLEGVTFEGFTESSHPAGVRTRPAAPLPR
jgi:hypothetical protein